ncbi:hypothetical protein [Candidatus Clostridium radicumherbarum]|uniref:Uncharacterized protein n=1 Tax=Candidatus Clostridium radicumherbarum TaxID=3381662 RepID=A0ABW8TZ27_9CLOT
MSNEEGNEKIDRRLVIKFTTLNEEQENSLVIELISFIYYYYLKTGISKDPSGVEVLEYYNRNIKKPCSIEKILDNFQVQVDAITYIEEVYSMVVLIMSGIDDIRQKVIIDKTKDYDREHHLQVMAYLLNTNKDNKDVMVIQKYLNRHNITDRNISNDYIKRIINKIYLLV